MATGEHQQEASVAGESPDKVERERSSGETTESGDGVARPENTAENERDAGAPAKAVEETAGETAEETAEGGAQERAAGADVTPEDAPEDASTPTEGDGSADPGKSDPEAEDGREGGASGDGGDEGDERLKSAVAAWVAREGGSGKSDRLDDSGEGDNSGDSVNSGETDKSGKSGKGGKAAEGRGGAEGAKGATSANGAEGASDGQVGEGADGAKADEGADGSRGAKGGEGAKGAKGANGAKADEGAVSAGRAKADEGPGGEQGGEGAKDAGGAKTGGGSASTKRAKADEGATGAKRGKGDQGAAGAKRGIGDEGATGAKSAKSAKSAKADEGAASAKQGKGDERATSGNGATGVKRGNAGEGVRSGQADARGAEGADSGPSSGDLPVREPKSGKPDKSDDGDPPTAMFGVLRPKDEVEDAAERAERLTTAFFGAPKTAAKTSDPEEKAGKKPAEGEKAARENKAVDQPTATFRTKPQEEKDPKEDREERKKGADGEKSDEKPSVNENTTVLKLPSTDRPKADPRAPYRREEESESERTSQFVPLKSTDAPRKPAQPKLEPKQGAKAESKAQSKADPKAEPKKAPAQPPQPPRPPQPPGKPAAQPESQAQPQPQAQPDEVERTRQQPLPDGGQPAAGGQPQPLDLLAQLTNTPPPPETAIRTLTRRVKIWTPLALLLLVLFVVAQAVRPLPAAELEMTASKTYGFAGGKPSMPWPSEGQAVVDVDGLGSLGSYGKEKPVPIASVAKVMTAYVILRDHPVKKGTTGAKIPVDQKAEDDAGLSAQNESTVDVKKGQTLTEKEAINAIMIASANNVARLLARWDAGSEKAFVKKMNDAAKELGMTNSTYTDPSGLKAETRSTAADQVKLGKKVMEIPLFREIVKQPQYKDLNGKTQPNWNKLVPLDGVVGIKTGTTTKAGGNLLFAAEKEIGGTKQLIVGAVLGQYKPSILDTVLGESKKLIDAGQDALQARKVVKKGDVVGHVDDQLGGETPVVATKDVTAVGWSGLKVKLGLTEGDKSIPHTGEKGDKVGTLTVGAGPGQVKVPVALQEPMTEPGFGSKLTRIL
ncbi:serine hydrolase [Streptomyces sp. NPDC048172]|uniref:serine hydrolase n=1 Tax=Streptomyces sp. NPDC048172 TaxID=3365505 RepID=UPI0037115E17